MLWHWSSMKATPEPWRWASDGNDLGEDAEELVRVGRSDQKIVVGVEAAVEVEPAEAPEAQAARRR